MIKRNCQKGQPFAAPPEPGMFSISAKQVSQFLNWMYLGLGNTVILIKIFGLEEKNLNLHQAFIKKGKESYWKKETIQTKR